MQSKKKKKKKFPLWGKILVIFLSLFLLFLIIGFVVVYKTLNNVDKVDIDKSKLGITSNEELKQFTDYEKIKNIALFGIDSEDGVGRSDSIMIATIDPIHDKLKITSIMRDSYVNIDGYGYDKINHAYAYGGPELSIKTINQTFGLNIEDFVSVDFASLPKIIDLLGGIELNITDEEINCNININNYIDDLNYQMGTNSPNITHSGTQYVDGVQALAYSRIRYTSGGDYERTHRQRIILEKLFEKALAIPPSQYLSVINDILPYVKTTLEINDILLIGTNVLTMGGGTLEQDRFPRDGYSYGETINDVFYLTFDEATAKEQMMNYIFDDK